MRMTHYTDRECGKSNRFPRIVLACKFTSAIYLALTGMLSEVSCLRTALLLTT